MHTDILLRDAYPAFSLDFVGILLQKRIRILLGIFGDTLAFAFMNFSRVASASTTAEIVIGRLRICFNIITGT